MSTQPTISRVVIELARTTGPARRATSPYLLHQSVADLFGDREGRGYLFRVLRERAATRERPATYIVLVLSEAEPLPLTELKCGQHRNTVALESKPFEPRLRTGQLLDYEIKLNATCVVTEVKADGKKEKKRRDLWEAVWKRDPLTPLSPHEVYGGYLTERLSGAAEVLEARVTERGEVRARPPASVTDKGEHSAAFVATNLIGTLRVEDTDALIAHIATGIGRAKAFGCGLLCLSRPGTVLPRRLESAASQAAG